MTRSVVPSPTQVGLTVVGETAVGAMAAWLSWFGLVLATFSLVVLVGCDAGKRSTPNGTPAKTGRVGMDNQASDQSSADTTPTAATNPEPALAEPTSNRQQQLATAGRLIDRGRYAEAGAALKRLLVADPDDVEVVFMLANVEAAQGRLAAAVDLLAAIPAGHPEAGIPALGQSADWCMELGRYEEAEAKYVEVLQRVPEAFPARRQLAFLLNRQGRRHEAAAQIHELCKLGNVRQDELHSLVMLSHAMYDDPDATAASSPAVVYSPILPGGMARKLFTDGKFSEAADALEPWIETGTAPAALVALYGRAVVEAQDDQRFLMWLSRVNDATKATADYWAALGTYLISQRRFEEATRALLEASDRDPTDMYSYGRLGQTLLTLGDEDASARWLDRWDDINELVQANNRISETNPPDPDRIDELVELLEKLNRPLEAVLWQSIADHYRGASDGQLAANRDRLRELVETNGGFATQGERLCGLDLQKYPLPSLAELQRNLPVRSMQPRQRSTAPTPARFENMAEQYGLRHAFQVAAQPQTEGFAIYQTYGGAVVALDFELDGRPDLYFSQGGSDPPSFQGPISNQLFRNLDWNDAAADTLVDVSTRSQATDYRYSLGATSGDWNQDGFPDLAIANLGDDSLLINNGDGTFTHQPIVADHDEHRVPTSLAIADLNGDAIPDMLELSYVDDPTMIFLPTRNESRQVIKAMSPMQYKPGPDRLCMNDGKGGMSIRRFNTDPTDYRTGLGLIVTDWNHSPGNEIFIGNDLYPDQMWVRNGDTDQWSDIAPAVGCAFGIRGSKTASMGIAAGDVDNSGTIDIHITNYQNRNSSLFLNLGDSFLERNVQYGLAEASQAVLGFGTQTLDYDNDGLLDLAVTNGHIEKAITIDEPFEQPAQLFANLGGRFELLDVTDPSGYWQRKHLGRGLARVDINRDGLDDVVITHLGESSALLVNRTEMPHHWLQIQLVGVDSERDAVGARVTIEFEGKRLCGWVTAGDGYLSRNESVLGFGLGTAREPVRVEVAWPSGGVETIPAVEPDQRVLIVEGESTSFTLP